MRFGLVVAAAALIFDRLAKILLMDLMRGFPGGIEVTPFFNLVMVWNRGISFGLFSSDAEVMRWVLIVLTLAIVVLLLWWLRQADGRWLAAAFGLMIGGALSNAGDRLFYGAVADFFDFHLYGYHWPAFNFSDTAIVAGVAVLLVDALFGSREKD